MYYSTLEIWTMILALGLGTFLLRLSFLGMTGKRSLPESLLRYLRYTPVAVLPGLVAPGVLWPAGTDGIFDPARLIAAMMTVVVGIVTRNTLAAICAGALTLYAALYLLG
ncbi:AzlD domain-containing protein [Phaeovulum sp. W22_SRMD_FR3]|uniref:AzlD domain-containing protein n=1 Tax=Phaeovulum sp. W22_SRMD_FR3 TaxID=3240274 RepID=UPI003F995F38